MTTTLDGKPTSAGIHLPSLAAGLAIMVVGTVYPPLMAKTAGGADHVLATLLLWAMSAGLVRGVGFVPRHAALRWIFSGWACSAASIAAIAWRLMG